ncbi:hypothetical protein A9Q84_05495 [Halobacteriovorax marinus]|uniref:Dialkylrecorsinol condensing enzyme n=1 Tax=Halobacteriovorax marinus TaxID=97084 RepID=A0A1Y5FBD1_9BACT|nr:hypothetical protein A9Q84_05495 [Halobacteriovorax marinus]
MKKALVITYSQIGQTKKAITTLCNSLEGVYQINHFEIQPHKDIKFPWGMSDFFRAFPNCVNGITPEIQPIPKEITSKDYDLVIIGYQIWFLSASLPFQAVLKDPSLQKIIQGKPVIGVVTSRNMWISGVTKTNNTLLEIGAKTIRNLVLCDTAPNWATFVTTPRWMLTGKKNAFWIFPEAGIAVSEFKRVEELGRDICAQTDSIQELDTVKHSHGQELIAVLMEYIGIRVFTVWARLIEKLTKENCLSRDILLIFFRVNLVSLILTVLPVMTLLKVIIYPLFTQKVRDQVDSQLMVK